MQLTVTWIREEYNRRIILFMTFNVLLFNNITKQRSRRIYKFDYDVYLTVAGGVP